MDTTLLLGMMGLVTQPTAARALPLDHWHRSMFIAGALSTLLPALVHAYLLMPFPVIRRVALELGRRWVVRGALEFGFSDLFRISSFGFRIYGRWPADPES